MKSKLSDKLRFAHAAEIAAWYAYDGHWRSLRFSRPTQAEKIRQIQQDEANHIKALKAMLTQLKSEPSKTYDKIGTFVGKCIWNACFIFGWRPAMFVAGLMEKIGTRSYREIADIALNECYLKTLDGQYLGIAADLMDMAKNEEEHEEYFKQVRKNGNHS